MSSGTERHFWSATQLAAAIAKGDVSSSEVTAAALERIDRYDGELQAICIRRDDQALEEAAEADAARDNGEPLGPFHGVPVTIKEAYDLVGTPSTWGLPARADHRPDRNATVVARLQAAGAVVIGKTNVPPGLADWQSANDLYGRTKNPWDLERTPGGSSGGSAVSLAAGFGFLDAGSDIGGSLRNPAHFCGIAAHKPSYGLVPSTGHALDDNLRPTDLAVCGPMARTAADLDTALMVMAGPDGPDALAYHLALPAWSGRSLEGVRVAVVEEEPVCRVDAAVRRVVTAAADAAEAAGAVVTRDVSLPVDTTHSHDVYVRLLRAVASAGLSDEEFEIELGRARTAARGSWTARVGAAYTQSHRDWLAADLERSDLRRAWAAFFENVDVVLCPVAPTVAWGHCSSDLDDRLRRRIVVDDTTIGYYEQLFWAGITVVAGLPSTVVPAGLAEDATGQSLPVGVQLIGPYLRDRSIIGVAAELESQLGGFRPPPAFG